MPQPIILPRQPTFMDQFLPSFNQAMQMMMMMRLRKSAKLEARQETLADRRFELEKDGWTPINPDYTAPTEAEKPNYMRQGVDTYQKPDITVGDTAYRRPKTTFDVIEKKGQLFAIQKKGNQLVDFDYISKKDTDPSLVKQYKYAVKQHSEGIGANPGDFTTWSKNQKKAGATTINVNEKVNLQNKKQVAKMKIDARSPRFKQSAVNEVKAIPDSDMMTPKEFVIKTREVMKRNLENIYGEITLGQKGGKLYFADKNGRFIRWAD